MSEVERRLPQALAALILVLFAAVNLRGLDATPPVNQDEAWIAAPGVEFFTSGRFATPLFAGYYGSERHYYDFMPLLSLIDGAAIKAFGMNLVTVRTVSVTLAALTLLLTYLAGRRLLSEWHGVLAMIILSTWPIAWTGLPALQSPFTGIPLTDLGRIGRYDILVPVFGLASLLAIVRGLYEQTRAAFWLTLAGVLAALATLSHYYGIIWLIAVAALVLAEGGWRNFRMLQWPALGFAMAMTPWVWFITRDFGLFIAQKQAQAQNYFGDVGSVTAQLERFAPVLSAARRGHLASLLWIALAGAGLVLLIRAGWRRQSGARLLAMTTIVVLIGYALLVRPSFRYLSTVWPLLALAASYGALHPWPARSRALGRGVLALLMAAASIQGIEAYRHLATRAGYHTAYSRMCQRIAQAMPASARLLALQHWWLGVSPRVQDYRSFLVPITRMNPRATPRPITFAEAMALDPMDYILIDPAMRDVIRASGDPARPLAGPLGAEISAYLRDHATRIDSFEDRTYGRFALYRVNGPGSALTR